MRRYRHLPSLDASEGRFSIRCVSDDDIEPIRRWRNAQMAVLRQDKPISEEMQRGYFDSQIWPQLNAHRPRTILLAILQDHELIGYGGLVHCLWEHKRAEISVLFNPDIVASKGEYSTCLRTYLALIPVIGFSRLGFGRLFLETYDIRPFHIGLIEEAGFVCEARLRSHVIIDGQPVDSLIHAMLAEDYFAGGRMTSHATRSTLVPSAGGS